LALGDQTPDGGKLCFDNFLLSNILRNNNHVKQKSYFFVIFFADYVTMDGIFFWSQVKSLIDAQNTSQEWVASKAEINFGTMKQQIHHNRLPDAVSAQRIAAALGTSVEYLVTGQEPGKPDTAPVIQKLESALDDLKKL
jgi:hypothetical protein